MAQVSIRSVFYLMQKRFLLTSASNAIHHKPATGHNSSSSSNTLEQHFNPSIISSSSSSEKHEESVTRFFKSYGFSDAHISKLVVKCPRILKADVDQTLKPKMDCLVYYGFSGSDLQKVIVTNPNNILSGRVNSHMQPTLDLLKTYLGSNKNVVVAVKRCSGFLYCNIKTTVERNINFLISEGVSSKSMSKLISHRPRTITSKADRMVGAVKYAKQLGFRPNDPMFVIALWAILSMSKSTFSQRIETMKNLLGCSEQDVNSAIKRYPLFLQCSDEKLKNVTNFFVNTVKVEASVLLSNPSYYTLSLDKRVVPRYNVYKILESNKLLKEGAKFTRMLTGSEKWFESNYVVRYLNQFPNLMELYRGYIQNSKTQSIIATTK